MELLVGLHTVEALVRKHPKQIQALLVDERSRSSRQSQLVTLARNQGITVEATDARTLEGLCGHSRHQGVAVRFDGELERNESTLRTDLAAATEPLLVLVLDGVTDPHNLGACLRSAEAVGVDAVIVPKDNSAALTPAAQKVAAGAAATAPLYRVTNLARTLQLLQEAGVWVHGAVGDASEALYEQDLTGSVALVLGAEGKGMRKLTRGACDKLYKIPMSGTVESLNVSVAAGISLFEAHRQRKY